eukprot:TRINITY_DN15587_c0_g3_i1.p2 TRINITY_DN15587_c0_g3~~TRINITY_DN15587_c0_g3_i1.p2  ORF type:complete len:122 (+),score=49.59 TRINITY_DN15587_c0_g3_i1:151-516(+)
MGNFLRVVSYQEEDVVSPSLAKHSLLHLYYEYLEKMIESGTKNVREYLEKNSLPDEVTKHFDASTEELLKSYSNLVEAENTDAADSQCTWKTIEELENKEEKIKEMKNLISKIDLFIEEQD